MKETKKERDLRVARILEKLDREYGSDGTCYLKYNKDQIWQLLFAVIMSAQCTDARVNLVTRELWKKYPTLEAVAAADPGEFENDIRSTGFYHNKAKNILACAGKLLSEYGGKVPSGIEELTSLPGVGRKTANVIRGNVYNDPSIVVDTHVKRISNKLGLVRSDDPVKVEFALMKVLPKDHWILWNIDIIRLGRTVCVARKPRCEECFLREECPSAEVK
jgi:endonuclease-3